MEYSPCTRAQHEWGHGIGWNLVVLGRCRACSYWRFLCTASRGYLPTLTGQPNQTLLALALGDRLYKKIGFYSKAIFELLEKSILGGQLGFAAMYRRFLIAIDNYYGQYYKSLLAPVLGQLDYALVRWAKRKYRRLKVSHSKARAWIKGVAQRQPRLFAHWQITLQPTTGQ